MEANRKSKAIVVDNEDHYDFKVAEVNVANPGEGEVLVEMHYATFTVEDTLYQSKAYKPAYPFLGGYDGSGKVVKVGAGVDAFKEGDSVSVFLLPARSGSKKSNIPDGIARKMRAGTLWRDQQHLKAYTGEKELAGFMGLGTWSQYAVFPEGHLLKINEEPSPMNAGLGSLVGPALAATRQFFQVEEGSTCAVFGSSVLSVLIVLGLRRLKCNIVVVSEGVPSIEALFDELGCYVVRVEGRSPTDVKADLLKVYELGYDYTFECSNYATYGTIALEVCHKGWG